MTGVPSENVTRRELPMREKICCAMFRFADVRASRACYGILFRLRRKDVDEAQAPLRRRCEETGSEEIAEEEAATA